MKGAWYEDVRRWQARYAKRAVEKQTELVLEVLGSWLRLAAATKYMAPDAVCAGAERLGELVRQVALVVADVAPQPKPSQEVSTESSAKEAEAVEASAVAGESP